jgi:hypothetical protein
VKDPCFFIQGQLSFQYLPCNFYFHFQVAWGYNAFKNKWLVLTKTLCELVVTKLVTHVKPVLIELVILVEPVVNELVTHVE